ncbi:MAG: DUF445 family protein [Candidatus Sericytochromatia bacterium]
MIEFYPIIRPFLQPIIGAFHGWFATRMVVVMLFRPHETYYIWGRRVPFTPGIFPRRKSALASNIGRTVTESLLTPQDIGKRLETFITEENINKVVNLIIEKFLPNLESPELLEKISNNVVRFIPTSIDGFSKKYLEELINNKDDKLSKIVDYIVNDVILELKIKEEDATSIINYVFENFISPQNVRVTLYNSLTPERATNLQNMLRERTSGALKFILSFANLESIFNNLKEYLNNEPEASEELIADIINQLKLKEDLISKLLTLDLKTLSFKDIANIKHTLYTGISDYLKNNQATIDNALSSIKGSLENIVRDKIISFKITSIKPELFDSVKSQLTIFIFNYLQREAINLVDKGLSTLKPREMIETKINAYSSQNVEDLILGIMKKELKNLEILGLIIGILLGIIALGIEKFLPY